MENIIEVRGLTKKYQDLVAVNNLDLDISKGRILGLLGPNGSGKSTTINCILSLLSFDAGSIKIMGKEMTPDSYDIKQKLGVVFQDVGVFEELTVYENIDYFCGLYVRDKAKRKEYIQETIDLVGLNDFVKFRPKELSGGLLRRLNIACGISHKPSIIFLDEPTVAVDPQTRNNILEGIKKLNKDGATIIYTSHYMEEIELICDDIVIIDKGQVLAKGSADELKNMIDLDEKVIFESEKLSDQVLSKLEDLDNVIDVEYTDSAYRVTFKQGQKNLVNLIDLLNNQGISYDSVSSLRPSLNDVFLDLTGRDLRD